jgi:coenzyme F420-reducing hydrogenase gamma subunit
MPVTVASEWLNSCSGCEIAILNIGEALLGLLPELDFTHTCRSSWITNTLARPAIRPTWRSPNRLWRS